MRSQDAPEPAADHYRIAYWPDPLAFPPREIISNECFDAPLGLYRVLYVGTQQACFVE